jgi:hypothetical protein
MQTYSTPTGNGPATGFESSSSTDQAKDKARDAAGQAKEQAQQAAGQAKGAVRSQVDQRSTEAGERVGGFASDVRSVGDQLREQGKDQPAKLAEQAAQRAESLGDYLKRTDGDTILRDLEDFGRQRPWAVIAGGVALGFAASRFLKASSTRRYESSTTDARGLTPGRSTTRTAVTTADVYGPVGTGAGTGGTGASLGGSPATGAAPGTGLYTDGERGA